MRLLMLSGNSLHNRDWIMDAQQQFSDLFDETYVQQYRHWSTGEAWINLTHELDELRRAVPASESEYAVFAKSIGTVLTVQAIEHRIIRPAWLLFCGLPLGYIVKSYPEFAQVTAASELPVTIVHNAHDPVGEAKDVKKYLANAFAGRDNYTFIEAQGDTHDYENFELLRSQLKQLRDTDDRSRN